MAIIAILPEVFRRVSTPGRGSVDADTGDDLSRRRDELRKEIEDLKKRSWTR